MSEEKQCNFHSESMKQMAADIKELNQKVADIPVLIAKLEQFIDATKKMQEDLEVVSEIGAKIMLLERQVASLEKEKETCLNNFNEFKKEEFKPIKEALYFIKGVIFAGSAIWAIVQLIVPFLLK